MDLSYTDGYNSPEVQTLQNSIISCMKTRLKQLLEDDSSEENAKFCHFAEAVIMANDPGNWKVVAPASQEQQGSFYGALFMFEYEGECYMYGWDKGRYSKDFFFCPRFIDGDLMPFTADNFIYTPEFERDFCK